MPSNFPSDKLYKSEKDPPPYPVNKLDFISFNDLVHISTLGNEFILPRETKEVLSNNAFVLKLIAKPLNELNNNTIMNNYYSHVSYMWWSKYLVRDDEVYLPDEFDIKNLKSGDILLDAIEDYVIY